MEVMLARLAGLPSVGESTHNGVDYTSDLLGKLIFSFLRRLSITSLLVVSLSSSIFCSIPSFVCVVIPMSILLMSSKSSSYCMSMTVWPIHKLG